MNDADSLRGADMQWQLSEEQEAYQSSLGDWLEHVAPADVVRGWLESEDQATFAHRFASEGWAAVGIAEELGGQGGGLLELCLTAEALGRSAVPSAGWLANVIAVPALAADPESAERAFGDAPVALLTPAEVIPGAGPVLHLDADGRVSGVVPRVLGAAEATRFVAIVGGGAGLSLRLVEAGSAVSLQRHALLDRSRSIADVTLDAAPSEPLNVDAGAFLAGAANRAAVLVAADSLGAMQAMLTMAVDYSKQRHQFGVPIGSFQAVKHAAASILVDIEGARSAIYYTAAAVDGDGELSDLQAAAVKAQVTAAGVKAADSALTLHGAIGYTWEHDLHHYFKRAKLNEHLFGAPGRWNERIADGLALAPL
jgi:alkylation response protein AidB-like acyl-CoA dehydrogenase